MLGLDGEAEVRVSPFLWKVYNLTKDYQILKVKGKDLPLQA
jgi:hypothetical protein